MKICILDGTTTNPGYQLAEIEAVGELSVYDFTQPDQILERAAGAEILLTNKTPLDGAVIAALRERGLRYIGTLSTDTTWWMLRRQRNRDPCVQCAVVLYQSGGAVYLCADFCLCQPCTGAQPERAPRGMDKAKAFLLLARGIYGDAE